MLESNHERPGNELQAGVSSQPTGKGRPAAMRAFSIGGMALAYLRHNRARRPRATC